MTSFPAAWQRVILCVCGTNRAANARSKKSTFWYGLQAVLGGGAASARSGALGEAKPAHKRNSPGWFKLRCSFRIAAVHASRSICETAMTAERDYSDLGFFCLRRCSIAQRMQQVFHCGAAHGVRTAIEGSTSVQFPTDLSPRRKETDREQNGFFCASGEDRELWPPCCAYFDLRRITKTNYWHLTPINWEFTSNRFI
jgi:hypothetical protein